MRPPSARIAKIGALIFPLGLVFTTHSAFAAGTAPDRWYYDTEFYQTTCFDPDKQANAEVCKGPFDSADSACRAEIAEWNSTYSDNVVYNSVANQYKCATDRPAITYWVTPGCSQGQLTPLADGTYTCGDGTAGGKPIVIGFFNGVWNTQKQANDGMGALEALMGESRNGTPLIYRSFYNQTGSENGATGMQDIAEVFMQRAAELDNIGDLGNRWEMFWDALAGRQEDPDSFAGALTNALSVGNVNVSGVVSGLYSSLAGQAASKASSVLSSPPTEEDYAKHLALLNSLVDTSKGFVLVAHSQGNLFVNHAYDNFVPTHPNSPTKVVHVAPASPTLRGDYFLSDNDFVINPLRLTGTVPDNNWSIALHWGDVSGHTFTGTYLDETVKGGPKGGDRTPGGARTAIQGSVNSAIDAVNTQ